MNLKILVKWILIVWLPLASLKLNNETSAENLVENEKKSRSIATGKKENALESQKKAEENPIKAGQGSPYAETFGKPTLTFPTINSANLNFIQKIFGTNAKSAHKLTGSVKKDLSALNKNNMKRSAAVFKSYSRNKRKTKRRTENKSKVRKRETSGEDANSLDDYEEDDFEKHEQGNSTEMGSYLGAPCELTCSEKLLHVFCDPRNRVCECEEKYPVQLGVGTGCEKPKQLGDQCFYAQTCSFFDPNAVCTQINHNAICQCKPGFHTVALRKGVKRMFCSEDIAVVSADLPTLLGVATGIAVLTGLICFVLRLFSGNRYPNTRHYANSNIAPPLLLSSDNQWINGIPLTVHGRPSSRSSVQRSTMSLAQYSRSKGVMVPASRAGAARAAAILLIPCHLQASRHSEPEVVKNSSKDDAEAQQTEVEISSRLGSRRHSFSSVQSTTSSQKSMSYSARRFEQENQQREQRAAMRAAREDAARGAVPPTPSPMSTDGLIPPSENFEEDPLCSNSINSPAQSEPPALAINKAVPPTTAASPINPANK